MKKKVMVIVKPDGLEKELLLEICQRIEAQGLKIVKMMKRVMSVKEVETLYGHVKMKYPKIWRPLKDYVTGGESVFIVVEGQGDVVAKLQALRGASDPSKALRGTIRGDFAPDQDMLTLYDQGKVTKNIMHSPDDQEQAKREYELFFGKEA